MRPIGKIFVLSVLVAVAGLPAGNAVGASSQTPQLLFGGRSPSLKNALLTAGDIEAVPEAPPNVSVSTVNDASGLYLDPDPRLPCARKAPTLHTGKAVDEQFSMPEVLGIEAAADLSLSKINSLFKLYESNIRIGCTYQSKTNTGSTQSVMLVKRIPMPQLVTHALGLVVVIRNNGQTFGAYEMVMSKGSTVVTLLLAAQSPVKTTFVVALARTTEERLLGRLAA